MPTQGGASVKPPMMRFVPQRILYVYKTLSIPSPMVVAKSSVQVGEITPLLFLLIRSAPDKLQPPLTLTIPGYTVKQPLFVMGLEPGNDYLIAAWIEPVPAKPAKSSRKAAAPAPEVPPAWCLASSNGLTFSAPLSDKAKKLTGLQQLPPEQLNSVRHGLIEVLPKLLKPLPESCLKQVQDSVSIRSELQRLSDGRIYFRFPHSPGRELPTTARLAPGTMPGVSLAMSLQQAEGYLHAISQAPLPQAWPAKTTPALLRAANSALWPLVFSKPIQCQDEASVLERFKPVTAARTRSAILRLEGGCLRGYCVDQTRLYEVQVLDVYLDGGYQGQVRADQAGIRFEDKPLNCGWSWPLPEVALDGTPHQVDLIRVDTQERLAGCPYPLGATVIDHHFKLEDGVQLQGRLQPRGQRAEPPGLVVMLDGAPLTIAPRFTVKAAAANPPVWQVAVDLPAAVNDGHAHELAVQIMEGGQTLAETRLQYQAHYVGRLERMDDAVISGWIYQKEAPQRPVVLDVIVNDTVVAQVAARHRTSVPIKASADGDSLSCGFTFKLGAADSLETSRTVALRIAGTATDILGPARVFTPYDMILSTLLQAQASLQGMDATFPLANGIEATNTATRWVREQIMAPLIAQLRQQSSIPASISLNLADTLPGPDIHPPVDETVVDIIVPVYAGLQETLLCLRSVLDNTPIRYELIVINDASPDPALVKMLRAWAGSGAFTLLENDRNQGFVATVNRGMQCHPDRDVVLLNADTIVPMGWLQRLQAAARSAAHVATATPFSNHATLLSFPRPFADHPVPEADTFRTLAEHFADCNAGVVMDIPTAVGFCLYIRREALNAVGLFDADRYPTGYGEENDFCLRASALGFRHLAACDVYVAHRGGVSFGARKDTLLAKNLATLTARFPDYLTTIERFEQQDVLRRVRNPVARRILKARSAAYLLFITHELAGGIKTHVDALTARLEAEGVAVLQLTASDSGACHLSSDDWPHALAYRTPDEWELLLDDLAELGVYHVHYHHVLHFPEQVWTLPRSLSVQYDVTLHDYYLICPTINLIDETGGYCGNSQWEPANCNRCLRINSLDRMNPGLNLQRQFAARGGTMEAWRGFHGDWLRQARQVLVPSQAAADIVQRHYALPNLQVKPHPESPCVVTPAVRPVSWPCRVAIIGGIGLHKGYSLLLECARSALKNGLPLEFVVFGETLHDGYFDHLDNVTLTGAYTPEELPARLAESGCVLAAFFSPWPETFGYTLSEAWRAGLYPVAFDLGAQAERIRATGYGSVIPYTRDGRDINDALIAIAESLGHSSAPESFSVGCAYSDIRDDYYGFSAAV